jgi:hypothetical protein
MYGYGFACLFVESVDEYESDVTDIQLNDSLPPRQNGKDRHTPEEGKGPRIMK